MRNCPYCKIDVGGNNKKCPFCQSKLSGTPEEPYFPQQTILKITSFFYKIQMFIVWTLIILSLGVEFLLKIKIFPTFYISLLITMWLLAFEFGIIRLFKKGANSSRVLTIFVIIVTLLLMVTAYFIGYYEYMVDYAVPVIIIGTMIANFVLAMIDKISNAMVYLLSNVVVGIVPYWVLYITGKNIPFLWVISLLVSVILFIGAIIFKGRPVLQEIVKRFNV